MFTLEKFEKSTRAYFKEHLPANGEIADVEGLACYLKITRDELLALCADENFERSVKLTLCKIAKIKKQLAFKGEIPVSVLSFDFKNNHGYTDKPEAADNGDRDKIIITGDAVKWSE